MLKNISRNKKHPYSEALHILLHEYSQGLSAVDIADKLCISGADCNRLLRLEQLRDTINADPYSGVLIYKSQREISAGISVSTAIKKARIDKFIKTIKSISTIITITVLSIYFYSRIMIYMQEYTLRSQVDMVLNAKKKLELSDQKNNLRQRIKKIQNTIISGECEASWQQNQNCYKEGRLLSKEDLEKELREMRLKIDEINDSLKKSS